MRTSSHKQKSLLKSSVRFVDELRIGSGEDTPTSSKNDSNLPTTSANVARKSSEEILEEKTIRIESYISSASAKKIKDANQKEILTFFQVHGSLADFTGHILHKTEGFIYMTTPPDGGYGWIILLAAFLSGIIIEGNALAVGTIFPSIEESLNVTKSVTAFIASLQITTYYCIGPISSAFINRLGFRKVSFVGLSCVVFGLIVGSFCTDFISLSIFYGFFVGCGCGMASMANTLIVAYYFEKYRTIAVGIQSSASGIGLLTYGTLNSYLSNKLGWKYTLLCVSISFGICFLFSAAYRKIEPKKVGKIVEVSPGDGDSQDSVFMATTKLSSEIDIKQGTPLTVLPQLSSRKDLAHSSKLSSVNKIRKTAMSKSNLNAEQKIVIDIDPLERVDIFSPQNADYDKSEIKLEKDMKIVPGREKEAKEFNYRMNMSRSIIIVPNKTKKSGSEPERCCTMNKKIKGALLMLFDVRLLKSGEFLILEIACCSFIMASFSPFMYAIERSNIPKVYANMLLPFIGVGNIILRISLGFVAYYTKCKTTYLLGSCIIIGGLGILLSCFLPHNIIWLEFLYYGFFTIGHAAFHSLRALVVINVLGIEKLTNAYGLIRLGCGIFSFIGVNISGNLVTYFNSTEPAFMQCAVFLLITGITFLITPKIIGKLRKRREEKDKDMKKIRF